MNIADRITVIETKVRLIEKLIYGLVGLIVAQTGIQVI